MRLVLIGLVVLPATLPEVRAAAAELRVAQRSSLRCDLVDADVV